MTREEDVRTTAAAVHSAVSMLTRRVRETKGGELALPERAALSRLDRGGPETTAGLARREEISPQAMGATVAALESKGYLVRSADPSDGRRSILTITEAGTAAVHAKRGRVTDRLTATLDDRFSDDDLAVLRRAARLMEQLAELI